MQFSNQYLLNTIKDAQILQGNCPSKFLLSIDSRFTKLTDVFFFLENTQYNDYQRLEDIIIRGVSGIVVCESKQAEVLLLLKKRFIKDLFVLVVPHVQNALYELAKHVRQQNDKMVIAVSGTSGVRATKTLLVSLLKECGMVVVDVAGQSENAVLSELCCAVINTVTDDVVIVFEAILHKRHAMKMIADISRPSFAIINSIGHYNIDTIGSLHDVAIEQRDIFSSFGAKNIGIVNGDQQELSQISYPHPIIKFGLKVSNQVQARKIRIYNSHTHFVLKIYKNKYPIVLQSTNSELLMSVLSVVATAKLLMIPDDVIIRVIQMPLSIPQCFEAKIIVKNRGVVIDDTYSADPESTKAALTAFHHMQADGPKIVVLGDMSGLGVNSAFWHRQIGRFLRKFSSIHRLIAIGKYGEYVKKTAPKEVDVLLIKEWQEATVYLQDYFLSKPVILVKGERSLGLSNLINTLCEK